MKRREFFNTLSISALTLSGIRAETLQSAGTKKPNIIYILADDLGYADLSCNGQKKFKTPNLDRMAAEGINFSDHHSGSTVCAPSRFTLMTGLHIGHAHTISQGQELMESDRTIASILKQAGYTTACIGKWGLGTETGLPNKKGFDFWYGFLNQSRAHHHYVDWLWRNEIKEEYPDNHKTHELHTQDQLTKEAINFISQNREKAFFLYLPYTLVHAELWTPEKYEKPYIDKLEDPEEKPVSYKNEPMKKYNPPQYPHAAHAGMVTHLDSDVGKILALLKELELDENTIVFFSSDNGPHGEGGADPKFFDNNGPYTGIKRSLTEGGIRVPFIVRWPGMIKPGSTSDHISYFPDILPTVTDICVLETGKTDGISLLPTLKGNHNEQKKHEYLFWDYKDKAAVRKGNWKAIQFRNEDGKLDKIVLYDLEKDISEENDLAQKYPEKVLEMAKIITSHTAHRPIQKIKKKKKKRNKTKKKKSY